MITSGIQTNCCSSKAALRVLQLFFAGMTASVFAAPGDLDTGFNPNVVGGIFNVFATALQPADAKIVIGGSFSTVSSVARGNFARLSSSGVAENNTNFTIGSGASSSVYCTAVQSDGKILLGGIFASVAGQANTNCLARLNPNGTVDTSFTPGTGPNDLVHAIALQADGKIIIGGLFTSVDGQTRNRIARLHANGTLESTDTFNPGTGADDHVFTVAVQSDGKILLGGQFTTVDGQTRNRIARLGSNGVVESTATFNVGTGANNRVNAIIVQPDSKILLGGTFSSVNGHSRGRIARLEANGSLESTTTFDPALIDDYYVQSMALQADGKILLAGGFVTLGGVDRSGIGRIRSNGSLDTAFDPGTGTDYADANGVALQADGKVLLVGPFTTINGTTRNLMARLLNDSATQTLNIAYSQIQWLRSGGAPELSQITFELTTNGGASWSPLGTGTRITGGWQLGGLSLPTTGSIRARGRSTGGFYNGSSGMLEQIQSFNVTLPTPSESWRLTFFGTTANTGTAADTATPDNDGIANLLKYALSINPGSAGNTALPQAQRIANRLALVFTRDTARSDISIHVEVADSLTLLQSAPTILASSLSGATTTGTGIITETDLGSGKKSVEVRDTVTMDNASRRFMRIRVVR